VGKWLSDDYSFKHGLSFGIILAVALVSFEIFNFSTTEFALQGLLGEARFIGVQWATILSIAFYGIDFAGLARLFTPEQNQGVSLEIWYLVGSWFLGATMNAMMTWWAVSLTMLNSTVGNEVLSCDQLITYVPIFAATLVWLTRILIIGTFSVAGERLFARARDAINAAMREAQLDQKRQWEREQTRAAVRRSPNAVSHVRAREQQPTKQAQQPVRKSPAQPPRAQYIGTQETAKPELRYESLEDEERPTIQVQCAQLPSRPEQRMASPRMARMRRRLAASR